MSRKAPAGCERRGFGRKTWRVKRLKTNLDESKYDVLMIVLACSGHEAGGPPEKSGQGGRACLAVKAWGGCVLQVGAACVTVSAPRKRAEMESECMIKAGIMGW